ncbi:hypothetical protein SDC9_110854 [bioreactor metagenome]|uniref:Uncharacterized protein n=1 Tax=bioreactor metagenome TaxID=1076179 RepID=A0A645BEU1_9ZZZZ
MVVSLGPGRGATIGRKARGQYAGSENDPEVWLGSPKAIQDSLVF